MTTNDEIYWQIVTTTMQINSLVNWVDANRENLEVSTVVFMAYTIRKLHLYIMTVGGIVWEPHRYQLRPRLLF